MEPWTGSFTQLHVNTYTSLLINTNYTYTFPMNTVQIAECKQNTVKDVGDTPQLPNSLIGI